MRKLMDFWPKSGQTVVLTSEEVSEAQKYRDMMKQPGYDLYMEKEYAERFERATVAQSLAFKAEFFSKREFLIVGDTYEGLAASVAKAYSIHALPIYVFYFAKVLRIAGQAEDAQIFFRYFQKALSDFQPDTFDQGFHNRHDVVGALEEAREIAPIL